LRTEIGPKVEANYPDNIQILQARPIELSVPSGFALEDFAEAAFRSIGVSSWEARAMAGSSQPIQPGSSIFHPMRW
jgi:hypothetical protein